MPELKSGDMVVLYQKQEWLIRARRRPQALLPFGTADNIISSIPSETRVLYMSSQRDTLRAAIAGRGKGPYGFRPGEVVYHLVLWGERPVWVSSEDAELRPFDAT